MIRGGFRGKSCFTNRNIFNPLLPVIMGGFNQGLSRSIFFSDVLEIFFRQTYFPLEILTNLPASILATCFLFLLSTHSLISWISQDSLIFCLSILFIFVLPTISLSNFSSFVSKIYLFSVIMLLSGVQLPYIFILFLISCIFSPKKLV